MFAISPTDINWFRQLKDHISSENEAVNFWTPTPWNIRKLKRGDKFFFMLIWAIIIRTIRYCYW